MATVFDKIKEFVVRLMRDESFQTLLQKGSEDECKQLLAANGYEFCTKDFESAAVELMEASERGEFTDLTHEELVVVFGSGATASGLEKLRDLTMVPAYGIPPWRYPFDEHPVPPYRPLPQAIYGAPRRWEMK